jgi:hypothetical protein
MSLAIWLKAEIVIAEKIVSLPFYMDAFKVTLGSLSRC